MAAFTWVFLVIRVDTARTTNLLAAAITVGCEVRSSWCSRRRFAVCFSENFVAHNQRILLQIKCLAEAEPVILPVLRHASKISDQSSFAP